MKTKSHTAEWTLCVLVFGFAAYFALHLIAAGGASPQSPLLAARGAAGGHLLLRDQWIGYRDFSARRTGDTAQLLLFDQFRARPNINTASASILSMVPGIGPKTAAKIIAYRDAAGRLESPSALSSIPGIGPRAMQRLGEALTFGEKIAPRRPEAIDLQ